MSRYQQAATCSTCKHFQPIDHPYLGRCGAGEIPPISGFFWRDDIRGCPRHEVMG